MAVQSDLLTPRLALYNIAACAFSGGCHYSAILSIYTAGINPFFCNPTTSYQVAEVYNIHILSFGHFTFLFFFSVLPIRLTLKYFRFLCRDHHIQFLILFISDVVQHRAVLCHGLQYIPNFLLRTPQATVLSVLEVV